MIPRIGPDMWAARTEALVANLRADEMLAEALGGEVVYVAGGAVRLGAYEFAVFVERRPNAQKDEYSASGGIWTVKGTWNVACVVRRVTTNGFYYDVSKLSANVMRNLLANRGPNTNSDGETIWSVAIVGVPETATVTSYGDEYSVEVIPVQLVFQVRI